MEENINGTASTSEAGDAPFEGSSGRFDRARGYMGEKFEAASGSVKETYNTVRGKVAEIDFAGAADQVRTYVRTNPGKALLISVGIGFVVGLLLRSEDED